jgi:hypothetical protein
MKAVRGPVASPDRVRFRLTWYQPLLPFLPVTAMAAVAGIVETGFFHTPAVVAFGYPTGMWLAMPLAALMSVSFGVTLTPSEAVVHNLRRRTIRWADVQGIWVESSMGARRIVIREANGRLTRLRAPVTGFLSWDSGFEEKFHTIGEWWLRHRGPEWTPAPLPGPNWVSLPR